MIKWQDAINGSRCLVAGGSGFIGRHLVDFLLQAQAREVIIIGRDTDLQKVIPRVTFFSCDLVSPASVDIVKNRGNVDYVFNLVGVTDARMPHPDPQELFSANVMPLIHLTQAVAWDFVRGAVHVGSNAEYGDAPLPHREDSMPCPTNAYGWSKVSGSMYASLMAKQGYASWAIARPFFVYGPHKQTGLIPNLVRALSQKKNFVIQGGGVTRDPIYVDDVAEGLIRLAITPQAVGEIINICNGKEISITAIADHVRDIIGFGTLDIDTATRKGDFLQSAGSNQKLFDLTGWRPETPLEKGLGVMVDDLLEPGKNIQSIWKQSHTTRN